MEVVMDGSMLAGTEKTAVVQRYAETLLPTSHGLLRCVVYRDAAGAEHVACGRPHQRKQPFHILHGRAPLTRHRRYNTLHAARLPGRKCQGRYTDGQLVQRAFATSTAAYPYDIRSCIATATATCT